MNWFCSVSAGEVVDEGDVGLSWAAAADSSDDAGTLSAEELVVMVAVEGVVESSI